MALGARRQKDRKIERSRQGNILIGYQKNRSTIGSLLVVLLVGFVAAATIGAAVAQPDASASAAAHSGSASIAQEVTECSDGIDNDGDNAIDDFDRDCESPEDFHELGSQEPECSNGADDDEDGLIDFGDGPHNDPDCESDDDPSESDEHPAECNDGIDNDHDGLIDFKDDGDDDGVEGQEDDGDPDCDSSEDPTEAPEGPECNDGIDNDGDGLIDFKDDGDDDGVEGQEDDGDPDCEDADDDSESPSVTCSEDIDADGATRSTFAPENNEGGLVSGIVYSVDKDILYGTGIPIVTGEGGVVAEVDCAVVVPVETVLGVNG